MDRLFKPLHLILALCMLNLAALATVGALWIRWDRQSQASTQWVAHTYQVKLQAEHVRTLAADLETGQRGFAITGSPALLEPYARSLGALVPALDALARLCEDNPVQVAAMTELRSLVGAKLDQCRRVVDLRRTQGAGPALDLVATGEGNRLMEAIRARLDGMQAEEDRLLALRQAEERAAHRTQLRLVLVAAAGILLLGGGLGAMLVSSVKLRARTLERLRTLAHADPLTGLANRRLLVELAGKALPLALRQGNPAAVLFLDLDGFKAVNDTFGHEAGDALLQEVACRLQAVVRASDILARLGGDEFVVLLPRIGGEAGALAVAAKVVAALGKPYPQAQGAVGVTASVGVALLPDHGETLEPLLQAADQALYRAKDLGKNRVVLAERGAAPAPRNR